MPLNKETKPNQTKNLERGRKEKDKTIQTTNSKSYYQLGSEWILE